MSRQVFVNVAVRDLARAKAFFTELGFAFDARFTDEKAASLILSEGASYVMLLAEPFFRTFTAREPCDTTKHTEALLCISAESRAAVDTFCDRALALGGKAAMPSQDHGFMYVRSFYDLDGHHWEVMWMDPTAVPVHAAPPAAG